MKPVYSSPGDQFIAEHDDAADTWVLTHRAEFSAMAKEAFPDGWRPGASCSVRERMEFLNRQCGIRAGFPDYATWCQRNGIAAPTQESAA